MKPKSLKDIVFVGLQLLLFVAFIIDIEVYELPQILPDTIYGFLTAGATAIFIFSISQLNKNLSPFPSPKTDSSLVTSGLFKYIRHPIYISILLGIMIWSLYQHSLYQLIISFVLLIVFYFKSKYEEQQLLKRFPEYKSYMSKTGRFLPRIFK